MADESVMAFFSAIDKVVQSVEMDLLSKAIQLIDQTGANNGKIIIAGNGGSAAMASHVAVDLTKNARIRAINFNEADLITCLANDYGYEHWVSKAITFYAERNDLVILISSSGMSKNMINGAKTAREKSLPLITFSGFNGNNLLRQLGDINFYADSRSYNVVEMVHHIWLLCMVERLIGKREESSS